MSNSLFNYLVNDYITFIKDPDNLSKLKEIKKIIVKYRQNQDR
jgi:hypothetical protein